MTFQKCYTGCLQICFYICGCARVRIRLKLWCSFILSICASLWFSAWNPHSLASNKRRWVMRSQLSPLGLSLSLFFCPKPSPHSPQVVLALPWLQQEFSCPDLFTAVARLFRTFTDSSPTHTWPPFSHQDRQHPSSGPSAVRSAGPSGGPSWHVSPQSGLCSPWVLLQQPALTPVMELVTLLQNCLFIHLFP